MSMRDVPALCETMPGYNIVDAALRRRHKACCGCLVKYCEEYFVWKRDEFHNLYKRVAGFVFIDLMHARCLDLASYRNFTVPPAAPSRPSEEQQHAAEACTEITEHDRRPISEEESYSGNWVLSKKLQMKCSDNIRRALRGSFDRSVLLWHIATDMCFRMEDDADGQDPEDNYFDDEWRRHKECAQAISNYMVHLLHFHPEMLMTGSRQHLVDEAMKEIKLILDDNRSSELWLRKPTQEDLENMIQQKEGKKLFQVVEACKLAKELRDMPEETRWAVMYHVWLGMLCYSASMCRGYLHAKSLGEGGEFLSFVWLVLSLKGAKTLADKLQMVDTDEEKTPAEATSSSAPKPKKNLRDKFGRR
uniref:DUF4220 domain-containing protein n=1 Tax=Arundo donax TaxID=35708 RepID=A0A0A9ERZ6_ARUDO